MANWLYNGVELPPLPADVMKQFPYATIKQDVGFYVLLSTCPMVANSMTCTPTEEKCSGVWYYCENGKPWEIADDGEVYYDDDVHFYPRALIFFTNYDLYKNGEIYRAASDPVTVSGNWIYNWVELPPLPEWDKTRFPYAAMTYAPTTGIYRFRVYSSPLEVDADMSDVAGRTVCTPSYDCSEMTWKQEGDAWGAPSEREVVSHGVSYTVVWTNHDIIDFADGSVYLAASTPIGAPKDEPAEGVSIGKKYLLYRMFLPHIAKVLSER